MKNSEKPMADRMIRILNRIIMLSENNRYYELERYCKDIKIKLEKEEIEK
jgi:hypothetical protein